MSNDLWRWADPDGQQRRVRLDELRSALAGGLIAPNTPVWRSGWKAWQPANEVPELTTSAVAAANGVVPNIPPPPLAMLAAQKEFEAKAGQSFHPPPPTEKAADEEPPPPPRFVPLPVKAPPPPTSSSPHPVSGSVPPPPASSSPMALGPPGPPASNAPPPMAGGAQLASALPTTLGLPPPPELAQMVATAKAAQPPPARTQLGMPAPPRPGAPPPDARNGGAEMIEELSGSMLLDEDIGAKAGKPPPPRLQAGGMPPPTDPTLDADGASPRDSFGDYVPPRRPGLSAIFEDFKAIKAGQQPKNKLLLGVVGILALMVLIMLIALVVSAFSSKPSEVKSIASSSASGGKAAPPPTDTSTSTSTTSTSTATTAAATASTPPAPTVEEPAKPTGPGFGDCTVAGDAHIISPRAFIPSAVESLAVPGAIALGFATSGRDAVALTVDPTSLAITNTVKTRATGGDVRRVSPVVMQGKLAVVPDVDKRDKLVGRRVIATANPIDVGVADNAVVWAPHGGLSYATMFPLDAEGGPVDALRGVPLTHTKGVAVTYRRAGAVYVAIAKGDNVLVPAAPTVRIAGLGPQVGSPAIGTSGDAIVVAWADRAGASDPWMVRWAKVDATGTASAAKELALPEGGLGTQAMAPSVAGLGNGRFLIAWTEGPVSNHQVRAQNLNADGSPSGAALSVSAAGLNAGQPQVSIGADGRGVVAFLAKGKAFYEIHATPLSCPPAK